MRTLRFYEGLLVRNSFLLLIMLCFASCSKDDDSSDDSTKEEKSRIELIQTFSKQLGYSSLEDARNVEEQGSYFLIAQGAIWDDSRFWIDAMISDIVIPFKANQLLYSYEYQDSYMIFGTPHYYTVTKEYNAFYSIVVDWKYSNEYKGNMYRTLMTDISITREYLGCSNGTPSQYIPTDVEKVVKTYDDIVSEWQAIPDDAGEDSNDDGSGSSSGKYYTFTGKTSTGFWQSGNDIMSEQLYIYKSPNGEERAATSYSDYHSSGSTHKIYIGSDPWGFGCNRYYISLSGTSVYFKI